MTAGMTTTQPGLAAEPRGGRLDRVVRYPVKGFSGQDLASASVRSGGGLPHDRVLAVANGTRTIEPGGGWTACQAFVRLTTYTDLPRYAVHVSSGEPSPGVLDGEPRSLRLTSPTGQVAEVRLVGDTVAAEDLPAADSALASWFPAGPLGPPRLVSSRHGLWDHSDAVLSLINLETVAELSRTAGRSVDPLRFRANLYFTGLPAWSELALVGRRIRLGDVELEVLRPTDRCRATAVDPNNADTDLNVPVLLAAGYGHLYCGVYARVVVGGRLATGQRLRDVGPAPAAVRSATMPSTAPPPAQWPRAATVIERVQESATVYSLWLRDPLAELRPAPLPGQHLRVHASDDDGPVWRSYTISAVDGDRLRISVRDAGATASMSRLLGRAARPGTSLLVSGPFGDVTLDPVGVGPVLLVSAGIGITPMVAMLRALAAHSSRRHVEFWHVARGRDDLALWPEARSCVDRLTAGRARLFLTREVGDVVGHGAGSAVAAPEADMGWISGRPRLADVTAVLQELGAANTSVYLCGPTGFVAGMRAAAFDGGVPPTAVYREVFTSPRAATGQSTQPPLPGPFRICFASGATNDGDIQVTWRPADGTLLDAAEAAGLSLPAGCRAGACGSCSQRVIAGSTVYVTEPVLAPPAPGVLLCCAAPTSDITVVV